MLVAVSALSVILVNRAREDNDWVVHTVEVENQISTLLLRIRTTESAARGYLLTEEQRFLDEYSASASNVRADIDELARLAGDNPLQVDNSNRAAGAGSGAARRIRKSDRLMPSGMTPPAGSRCCAPPMPARRAVRIDEIAGRLRAEEERLFALRTATADRTERLASIVTVTGSGLVVLLAGISIFLVRRSTRARDEAEAHLRDNNLNLEATVDERTSDLREANNEIQRFAYIVSHDLRSPLVNIMGFTSELEELRSDIFKRIASLHLAATSSPLPPTSMTATPKRAGSRRQATARRFFRSPRIHQVVDCENGPADFGHPQSHPRGTARIRSGQDRHARTDRGDRDDGRAPGVGSTRRKSVSNLCPKSPATVSRSEQIFSNLIDNALKYLKPGVPGDISDTGPYQARLCDLRRRRQWPGYRPEGPSTHFRSFPAGRAAGQAGARNWPCPCPRPGAAARRNHVGRIGA